MSTTHMPPIVHPTRRLFIIGLLLGLALLLLGATMLIVSGNAAASSHREAPAISHDPYADGTDTYAWVHGDDVVLVAAYIPFEGPEGGPNYFAWDDHVLYDINVDNDGDAKADVTYTLSTKTFFQNPDTFLYNTGPITSLNDPDWNQRQYITVTETFEGHQPTALVADQLTAPVNIGSKSTPDYPALVAEATRTYTADNGDQIKVYAGQRDDPFWVDLQVFDLLTLRGQQPPVGYSLGNNIPVDSLAGYNVHALVIEVPIRRLVTGGDPVLGVWATARRGSMPVLAQTDVAMTDHVQVSRLGMPLVNEAVMPLALKDTFNAIQPEVDLTVYGLLQKYVEDPQLGTLLCALYNIPLPGDGPSPDCHTNFTAGTPRSGRGDIFDVFLTGMKLAAPFTIHTANGPVNLPAGFNVNQPANVVPAEMIRVSTAISGSLCAPTPQRLGVLAGDACGFPNGRRLTDDVVEIELLAVAGAAYPVLDGRDASFSFNPALAGVLTDGVDYNDRHFIDHFPYLATSHSGQERLHQNPFAPVYMPFQAHSYAATAMEVAKQNPAGAALATAGGMLLLGTPLTAWLRRRRQTGRSRPTTPSTPD
ncbi:MAG: DUF4331 domain-containing protein [Caldilineales bacterium]|nr:DUF4331 domain-containing protein [Caldilineales bacterium]MCW5858961.1 DUF4331 domain-containing protein [Caldilineales bacterium]